MIDIRTLATVDDLAIPEPPVVRAVRVPDDTPTRDALALLARHLHGMIAAGEFRRLPEITLARLRVLEIEIERLGTREDWHVRRSLWWHVRRWWRMR